MMDWTRQAEAGWVYTLVTFVGLGMGAWVWSRRMRGTPAAFAVFVGAIIGAYSGAKLVFIAVEWPAFFGAADQWIRLAAGKSILGALLGGYAGVEIAKKMIGYREPTGDWFAVGVPLAIAAGRIGCLRYGCCPGIEMGPGFPWERWPAAPAEMIFNLLFVAAILPLIRRRGWWTGQGFHLYLVGYGLFRFAHEFLRDTPKVLPGVSGYQIAALALIALGLWRGRTRFLEGRIPGRVRGRTETGS